MNKNEEKTKLHDPDVLSADADVQADVDSVMRKYDRESNTRIWEGKPKIAITVILCHIVRNIFGGNPFDFFHGSHYFDGIFDLSV